MRTFVVSFFNGFSDNVPKNQELSSAKFLEMFKEPDVFEADEHTDLALVKKQSRSWNVGHFEERRKSENLVSINILGFDYDGPSGTGLTEDEVASVQTWAEDKGFDFVLHDTFSSFSVAPKRKIRVVFPLARGIDAAAYKKLWARIASQSPVPPDEGASSPNRLMAFPYLTGTNVAEYKRRLVIATPGNLLEPFAFGTTTLNGDVSPGPIDYESELRLPTAAKHTVSRAWAIHLRNKGMSSNDIWAKIKPVLESHNGTPNEARDLEAAEYEVREGVKWADENPLQKQEFHPGLIAKAEKELKSLEKAVAKDVGALRNAAFCLGQFGEVLETERVRKLLLAAAAVSDHTLPRSDLESTFDVAFAAGREKSWTAGIPSEWGLARNNEGKFLGTESNIYKLLKNHPECQDLVVFDVREDGVVLLRQPPWKTSMVSFPCAIKDHEEYAFTDWLVEKLSCATIHPRTALNVLLGVAQENTIDSFRDYLDGLVWDRGGRLDTWLVNFANAENTEYVRLVSSKWLIGAVARTYEPGCQMDTMLIFPSGQGDKKSSLFKALLPANKNLFSDKRVDIEDKDIHIELSRVVFKEIAELAGFSRKETTSIKQFITERTAKVRPPYGRVAVDYPRRGVLCGTVNDVNGFLKDTTGNRRFWPVDVAACDTEGLSSARDQLWAEAVARYRSGEKWWLTAEQEALAVTAQEGAMEDDPVFDAVLTLIEFGPRKSHSYLTKDLANEQTDFLEYTDQLVDGRPIFLTTGQVMSYVLKSTGIHINQKTATNLLTRAKWEKQKRREVTDKAVIVKWLKSS